MHWLIYKTFAIDSKVYRCLSYDVASGSEIQSCNKIDKQLVVYRFDVYDVLGKNEISM